MLIETGRICENVCCNIEMKDPRKSIRCSRCPARYCSNDCRDEDLRNGHWKHCECPNGTRHKAKTIKEQLAFLSLLRVGEIKCIIGQVHLAYSVMNSDRFLIHIVVDSIEELRTALQKAEEGDFSVAKALIRHSCGENGRWRVALQSGRRDPGGRGWSEFRGRLAFHEGMRNVPPLKEMFQLYAKYAVGSTAAVYLTINFPENRSEPVSKGCFIPLEGQGVLTRTKDEDDEAETGGTVRPDLVSISSHMLSVGEALIMKAAKAASISLEVLGPQCARQYGRGAFFLRFASLADLAGDQAQPIEQQVKQTMATMFRRGDLQGCNKNALQSLRESLRHTMQPFPESSFGDIVTYWPIDQLAVAFADPKNPCLSLGKSYDTESQFAVCVQVQYEPTVPDGDDMLTNMLVVSFMKPPVQVLQKQEEIEAKIEKFRAYLCATCGSLGARRRCGLCRAVRYCDRNCQSADWKQHKRTCQTSITPVV